MLATVFGRRIQIVNFNNAALKAFFDSKIANKELVIFDDELRNDVLLEKSKILEIGSKEFFPYLIPNFKSDQVFETTIVDPKKLNAIKELRSFVQKVNKGDIIEFSAIQSEFIRIDRKFNTNLHQAIIENNGAFPNFVRSDIELWEDLFELYFDSLIDTNGIETLSSAEVKPDLPGSQKIFLKDDYWDKYLIEMSEGSHFDSKLKLNLWRLENLDRSEDSSKIANEYGEWVYLTHHSTRHYLRLALDAQTRMGNSTSSEELDFSIRQCLYGLMQAADTELMHRISIPFKASLGSDFIDFDTFEQLEFTKFLSGNFPPTMAGVAKFLDNVRKSSKQSDSHLIYTKFDEFIADVDYLQIEKITQKRFIQKLYLMGRLRGSIMHPGQFNIVESKSVVSYLLNQKMPGEYFYRIGINIGF